MAEHYRTLDEKKVQYQPFDIIEKDGDEHQIKGVPGPDTIIDKGDIIMIFDGQRREQIYRNQRLRCHGSPIITGVSSGIGKALAEAALKADEVLGIGRRSCEAIESHGRANFFK